MGNNEITKREAGVSLFSDNTQFENAQRMAKALSSSTLVPDTYRNNISNTLVALEMSNRIGMSPFMVMQNMNVIGGRPSWSSSFIISAINSCGRFAPLTFEYKDLGKKEVSYTYWTGAQGSRSKQTGKVTIEDRECMAVTTDVNGKPIRGPKVTIEMAVKEGWYTKSDSKWQTIPELMLSYRSAAFFGRLYCPDVLMGMHAQDEIEDIDPAQTHKSGTVIESKVQELNKKVETFQEATVVTEEPNGGEASPSENGTTNTDTADPTPITNKGEDLI